MGVTDILIVVFAVAVALIISVRQIIKYVRFLKCVREYSKSNNTDVHSAQKKPGDYVRQLIPIGVCLALAVYIGVNPGAVEEPQSYITFLVVLSILFASSTVTLDMYNCLRYTSDSFLLENTAIPFSDVKELKSVNWRISEIVLKSGRTIKVSRRQLDEVERLCREKKCRVKRVK